MLVGEKKDREIIVYGNQQTTDYFPKLINKNVGVVVNHTSVVDNIHLIDTLLLSGINIKKIFVPEHGYRGVADAGEEIKGSIDKETGLPIISLYGKNKKPLPDQMQGLDCIVFDIQDVGVRFYTYLSTLHYVMEACAENNVSLVLLDRPNPNGDYVDGPVLDTSFCSFVGMHPIPVVHGMTLGELALMINGEGWLLHKLKCNLDVIKLENYNRSQYVSLQIKPSPNLPNDLSIRLYPSLCFFEATDLSIGRGTTFPFQVIGYPDSSLGKFTFTPYSIIGMSKDPIHEGDTCFGVDLRDEDLSVAFTLKYIIAFYEKWRVDKPFFERPQWFNLLAGNDILIKQIELGMSEDQIRATWQTDLASFRAKRDKYLLYGK